MNQPKTIITQIRIYAPVVTLSTQDNVKLLKQSESGCKRKINWNKYQPKVTEQTLNRIFFFFVDSSFQGRNRLLILSFEDKRVQESYKQYFLPTVEIKGYNVIDG